MLKKTLLLTSIALLTTSILGCTVTQPPLKESTDCTRLQRQYLYNTTNANLEAGAIDNTTLKQQLDANNCN